MPEAQIAGVCLTFVKETMANPLPPPCGVEHRFTAVEPFTDIEVRRLERSLERLFRIQQGEAGGDSDHAAIAQRQDEDAARTFAIPC